MTYSPTTESVRKAYAQLMHGWDEENVRYVEETEAREEFNNWYAEELRQAKADGFDEGVRASGLDLDYILQLLDTNPYRSQP